MDPKGLILDLGATLELERELVEVTQKSHRKVKSTEGALLFIATEMAVAKHTPFSTVRQIQVPEKSPSPGIGHKTVHIFREICTHAHRNILSSKISLSA